MLGERLLFIGGSVVHGSTIKSPSPRKFEDWFFIVILTTTVLFFAHTNVFAATKIPGADASEKLEAAGTLLKIVDSILFTWGAKIFAGLCVMSAGWNLKEQRFGLTVLCIVAAIVLGMAPAWVKNIFEIGGGGGVFSMVMPQIKGLFYA